MAFKDFAAKNIPRHNPFPLLLKYREGSTVRIKNVKTSLKIMEMSRTHFIVQGNANVFLRTDITSVITY